MTQGISYPPHIKPFVDAYKSAVAGILGWRLVGDGTLQDIQARFPGLDLIGLASLVLAGRRGEHSRALHVQFSFKDSVRPLITGEVEHHRVLSNLTQQLLGHCWEVLRQRGGVPKYDNPVIEFYRHVRNGCFHGNRFHFESDQPRHPAQWRGLVISSALEGRTILRESLDNTDMFLNWGDALILLGDVCDQ